MDGVASRRMGGNRWLLASTGKRAVMSHSHQLPVEDESIPMTLNERAAWVYLVAVVLTSGGYFALIGSRSVGQSVEGISWVAPMALAIAISVSGTVLGTIVFAALGSGCRGSGVDGLTSDVRDREIDRRGTRASTVVIGVGSGAALLAAMLDFDTFWIGNLLYLFGAVGAVVEATTKIRLYRRGF
jgi:hypothetical protein